MSNISEKDELDRAKVLLDIYRNENEQIKHEYRALWDKYVLLEKDTQKLIQDLENNNQQLLKELEMYNNSRSVKLSRKVKNSRIYKLLRKIVRK